MMSLEVNMYFYNVLYFSSQCNRLIFFMSACCRMIVFSAHYTSMYI